MNSVRNLKINESKLRDLYLRKIHLGEIQGPLTNIPHIDKEWLKYYNEEQIMADMPEMTIYEYMMAKNINRQNDPAIIYFNNVMTYGEFRDEIYKCAKSLQAKGIKVGDNVVCLMPNTPESLIMFYALNLIGAVAVNVHPLSAENEIKYILQETNAKMILTIDSSYNKVKSIASETNLKDIIVASPSNYMPFGLKFIYNMTQKEKLDFNDITMSWKDYMKSGNEIDEVNVYPYIKDKVSVILYTGGTTGKTKGVELTNDNFNSMVEQFILNESNFKRGDKMLTIMPVFHGFGLCSSIHLPLSQGVATILIPKLDIKSIDKLMNKYKPNHLLGVPTLFIGLKNVITSKEQAGKIKKMDLSYLKYVVSGGDATKPSFEKDINDFLKDHGSSAKLAKGYGLTECVAGVTFAYKDYSKQNSVGIPMVQTNIKIVKPGTEEALENGVDGEICVSGSTVMKGYYDKEEETNNTLVDGWVHTGDIGHFESGLLYFTQRKANMIISSGVNVYPSQIEEVIQSLPFVANCAVIGVPHDYKVEVPKAYIVLKEGVQLTDEIKQQIQNVCQANLNKYSIPYSYEYCDSLPQTLLGKISHTKLKEQENQKILSLNRK